MNRRAAVTQLSATASLLLGAAACTGTGFGAGGEPAYLLMDGPARASAHRLEIGGERVAPVLPLELDASEKASMLRGDHAPSPVPLEPGRLLYVRDGRVESWQLGTDVSRDALRIAATPEAAARLASALGARPPLALGSDATGAPVWKLEGSDVFVRAAWIGEVPDVREVTPEWLAGAQPGASVAMLGIAEPARGVVREDAGRASEANDLLGLSGDSELAGFVGLHTVKGQRVLLDTDGGWTVFDKVPCLKADGTPGQRGSSRRVGQHLLLEGLGVILSPGGAP